MRMSVKQLEMSMMHRWHRQLLLPRPHLLRRIPTRRLLAVGIINWLDERQVRISLN